MCNICTSSTRWLTLTEAVEHEQSEPHVQRVRLLDGRPIHISSDPLMHPTPVSANPRGATYVQASDSQVLPTTPDYHRSGPAQPSPTPVRHCPLWAPDSLPPSSPPLDLPDMSDNALQVFDDLFSADWEDGPEEDVGVANASTTHGPALPSDPPDMIYDNWGGFLSHQKPRPLEEDVGAGPSPSFDHRSTLR